ncbi:hypothetical protein [Aurantiacibacter sediminis]|uniref:hypothetical protein n=1 Tax=Aurantiacibacter sediminis TaxID=2793064 RepID=UPI001F2F6900|nr:hypothetical protein [Aurantiacibacter sediminis]
MQPANEPTENHDRSGAAGNWSLPAEDDLGVSFGHQRAAKERSRAMIAAPVFSGDELQGEFESEGEGRRADTRIAEKEGSGRRMMQGGQRRSSAEGDRAQLADDNRETEPRRTTYKRPANSGNTGDDDRMIVKRDNGQSREEAPALADVLDPEDVFAMSDAGEGASTSDSAWIAEALTRQNERERGDQPENISSGPGHEIFDRMGSARSEVLSFDAGRFDVNARLDGFAKELRRADDARTPSTPPDLNDLDLLSHVASLASGETEESESDAPQTADHEPSAGKDDNIASKEEAKTEPDNEHSDMLCDAPKETSADTAQDEEISADDRSEETDNADKPE